MPAWLLSVALHAGVFVAAALFFVAEVPRAVVDRQERRAEIVLVPATKSSSETQWLESPADSTASAASAAQRDVSAEVAEAIPGNPLAGGSAPAALSGVGLPTLDGLPPPGNDAVATPGDLGGRGRPFLLPGIDEAAILAEDAARPREALPLGQPAPFSFFGTSTRGGSFVFVIDRSESMGAAKLGVIETAAAELARSLEALSSDQYVQVVAYNQSAVTHARAELMPASDENKRELLTFVRKLAAFGGTQHNYGLQAALKMRPEVIFLLTDGGDPQPNGLQLRTIRDMAGGRTQIHALHFGNDDSPFTGTAFLKDLAGQTRGTYTYINVNKSP